MFFLRMKSIFPIVCLTVFCVSCVTLPEVQMANEAFSEGNTDRAYKLLITASQKKPNDLKVQESLSKVRSAAEGMAISTVVSNYSACGKTLECAKAAVASLTKYRQDYGLDQHTNIAAQILSYKSIIESTESSIAEQESCASDCLARKEFQCVEECIASITLLEPTSPAIEQLKAQLRVESEKYVSQLVNSCLKKNDFNKARDFVQNGTLLSDWFVRDYNKRIDSAELVYAERECGVLIDDKRYYTAYLLAIRCGEQTKLNESIEAGVTFYVKQAKQELNAGNVGCAYIQALKAIRMDPDDAQAFEIHRTACDQIDQLVQEYIAIPAFDSPADKADVGASFSDALISYLFRLLPYGINIVEREKIDMILEEKKMEFKQDWSLLNVNVLITGNVSLLNIDRQNTQNNVMTKVEVNRKREINPEYELYKSLSSTERQNLEAPEMLVEVPIYETVTYKAGLERVKGVASVAVRMMDTKKGRIIFAPEFREQYEQEDKWQDAVELAGVSADQINLPNDTEVAEKLKAGLIKQLAESILDQFTNRQKQFLEKAEYRLKRKEWKQAVQEAAEGLYYCHRDAISADDPSRQQLEDIMLDLTENDCK